MDDSAAFLLLAAWLVAIAYGLVTCEQAPKEGPVTKFFDNFIRSLVK